MNNAANKVSDDSVSFSVGDGATYHIGSDSHPVTIRKVSKSGYKIWYSDDDFRGTLNDEGRGRGVFVPRDVPEAQWKTATRRTHTRSNGETVVRYLQTGRSYGHITPGRRIFWDRSF